MERENVVFAMRAQQDGRRIRWEQMWTLAGRVFEGRRREHRRAQDREGMEETNELQREFNIGTCDLFRDRWEWVSKAPCGHATWFMPTERMRRRTGK